METDTIESRLAAVELGLAQIRRQLSPENPPAAPAAWEAIFGSFADSEGFEEQCVSVGSIGRRRTRKRTTQTAPRDRPCLSMPA